MKQQKKNGFFTFIFSLMPGAAEMYMGFMKSGLSLMGIFFLCYIIPDALNLYDYTGIFVVLAWFVSFFHARNLAGLKDEVFYQVQDEFIWESFAEKRNIHISNPTLRKWAAGTDCGGNYCHHYRCEADSRQEGGNERRWKIMKT